VTGHEHRPAEPELRAAGIGAAGVDQADAGAVARHGPVGDPGVLPEGTGEDLNVGECG